MRTKCKDCRFYDSKITRNDCGLCTSPTGIFKGMHVDPELRVCPWWKEKAEVKNEK